MKELATAILRFVGWMAAVVALFSPVWYTPIRNAPMELKLGVLVVAILLLFGYYVTHRKTMAASTKVVMQFMLGVLISLLVIGPLHWHYGTMADQSPELKLGALIFCGVIAFWYAMTHRTPDKTRRDRTNG